MKNNLKSSDLKKMASKIREEAQKIENIKMIKCAKYIIGLKALAQLQNKLRGK